MLGRTSLALTFALVAAAAAAQTPPPPPAPPAPLVAPVIPPEALMKLDALGVELEGLKALDLGALERSAHAMALTTADMALADTDVLFGPDLQEVVLPRGQALTIGTSESADYDRGTSYLDSGRYDRAVESFDKVIARNGKKADGAMYWKAYALNRLGRRDESIRTIEDLQKRFPSSRWSGDAKALLIDVRQASGQSVSPDAAGDEELKLIALNGIMQRDPERAIPMIEQLLGGSASPKVKERALFVLAQSASPRARTLLADVAKGKGNPDLQLKALDYLGAFGGGPDVPLLVDVYKTSGDIDVKKRVIRSLAMTGRRGIVFGLVDGEFGPMVYGQAMEQARAALDRVRVDMERNQALSETERARVQAEIQREMSRMQDRYAPAPPVPPTSPTPPAPPAPPASRAGTGVAGQRSEAAAEREKAREAKAKEAGDALWQLYQGETSVELKREILRNMRFSAQADRLTQIAKTETNPELRTAAIQGLMADRSPKTAETMLAIYQNEKDPAVRRQIIDNVSSSGSAATLVQMARQEKDPALRKRLVERLSMMKDKEAVDYMMEILKK